MKNSFPLAQKMLPEIYSTVDMIMKGRPLLVLLLFAASAVILAGMYYAATREGTTTRQDKWAGVLSDLDACSRRKHVKSAQYDHFAGIARQEREHDAERLFRAMAHAERLQEYNCANAIVRLGGRYAPPERVTVFHGRRQPAPEHRLRTPSAGGAACRRHRARPAKRQPLCGTRADLGEVRGHAASGADGDLPPPAGSQRTCGRTGQHRRQEGRQGFGRRFGKRNGNQFGERNGNQFGK